MSENDQNQSVEPKVMLLTAKHIAATPIASTISTTHLLIMLLIETHQFNELLFLIKLMNQNNVHL